MGFVHTSDDDGAHDQTLLLLSLFFVTPNSPTHRPTARTQVITQMHGFRAVHTKVVEEKEETFIGGHDRKLYFPHRGEGEAGVIKCHEIQTHCPANFAFPPSFLTSVCAPFSSFVARDDLTSPPPPPASSGGRSAASTSTE